MENHIYWWLQYTECKIFCVLIYFSEHVEDSLVYGRLIVFIIIIIPKVYV